MSLDTWTLCKYRLEQAEEDLLTAENNHRSGFYKAAINRSYYAIFHCIKRGIRSAGKRSITDTNTIRLERNLNEL